MTNMELLRFMRPALCVIDRGVMQSVGGASERVSVFNSCKLGLNIYYFRNDKTLLEEK